MEYGYILDGNYLISRTIKRDETLAPGRDIYTTNVLCSFLGASEEEKQTMIQALNKKLEGN